MIMNAKEIGEYKEKLNACQQIIKTYDPTRTTVDSHIDDQLGIEVTSETQFVKQVFYGCIRYKKILKIFLSNFYHENSGTTSRRDYTLYMIMSYLVFFRLEELGFDEFKGFLGTFDATTVQIFLRYIFNRTKLNGSIKTEWMAVLDQDYIENTLLKGVLEYEDQVEQYLQHLNSKSTTNLNNNNNNNNSLSSATTTSENKNRKVTIPKPPNLTQPKPRRLPVPIRISQEIKANPIPTSLKMNSLANIEKRNHERRDACKMMTLSKYSDPKNQPFDLAKTKTNLETIRREVEEKREAELKFEGFGAKKVPKYPATKETNVRLNIAAILREDALFKKRQEQEAKLIQAYESELRDSTEFYRWQSNMTKQDDETRRLEVECRRLEMLKSQKEAIESQKRSKEENRLLVQKMKSDSNEMEQKRIHDQMHQENQNRLLVKEIKEIRENAPRQAENLRKEENQRKRIELNTILEEDRKRKQIQDQIEQAQREDVIKQIKALEKVHHEQIQVFDPTETKNYGLLEEMSLVELKERLQLTKIKQLEKEQEKRQQIIHQKHMKQENMKKTIENLHKIRKSAYQANQTSKNRRKLLETQQKTQLLENQTQGNLQLVQKLKQLQLQRNQETLKIRQEEQRILQQKRILGLNKTTLEQTHFQQLLKGAQRQTKTRLQQTQTTNN